MYMWQILRFLPKLNVRTDLQKVCGNTASAPSRVSFNRINRCDFPSLNNAQALNLLIRMAGFRIWLVGSLGHEWALGPLDDYRAEAKSGSAQAVVDGHDKTKT
ncbi:hypothetical protein TU76_01775 [Pseudomonas psychrophila]|nr:hypothetical protein TU76_01775 [Pseudomonas psychrophila]